MNTRIVRRAVVLATLAGVAVAAAAIVSGGDHAYVVHAVFRDAGGLRTGFKVRIDGAPVGQVAKLDLDSRDRVVADLRIEKSAGPVGRDARATVRAADLLGEKFVDLQPGGRREPAPSGTTIPTARTAQSVELDDVINALDLPTRQALRAFVNEQGQAYVGRGRDLGALLAALPPSLDRTRTLLAAFGADNATLGRLVDESDRVVARVAHERAPLGRFVSAFAGTVDTLGRRSRDLGATVRRAPATLASARRALAALQGAAIPLAPAARGLRATAPQFTATLAQLPGFAAAAAPTLRTIRRVAPTLATLGRRGTPVVRRLQPLTGDLASFATSFDPVTRTLDDGTPDFLGVLEGWARATQARDAASHVFRFGATSGAPSSADLLALLGGGRKGRRHGAHHGPSLPSLPSAGALPKLPGLPTPSLHVPKPQLPKAPALPSVPSPPVGAPGVPQQAQQTLDYLLGP